VGGKEKTLKSEEDKSRLQHNHQTLLKRRGGRRGQWAYNGGDEFVQGIPYSSIELSQ
jgi:hypothetical protein